MPRDTPESVDDTVPLNPSSVPHAEYSSLADLLKQAGYKETRVYTPEAEKRKIIKRTFDDDEDEVHALYGAFGLVPAKSDGDVRTRQTITEPSLPMKSSSSLLRSLALKEIAGGVDNDDRRKAAPGPQAAGMPTTPSMSAEENAWWGGGFAAGISRAAKAVMDRTPPSTTTSTFDSPGDRHGKVPAVVGLGLAHSGQGVRKVKSDLELERKDGKRRQQEDIAPLIRCRSDSPPERLYRQFFVTPPPEIPPLEYNAPPPPALDEDVFGYSPLPEDYEAQCDEDDVLYSAIDSFQVGSLGSSRSRTSSERSVDSETLVNMTEAFGSISTVDTKGPGARILMDAIEYDDVEDEDEEYDTDNRPTDVTIVLPNPEGEEEEEPQTDAADTDSESDESDDDGRPPSPRYREWSVGSERPIPLDLPPRALKYSDRAATLRNAKSTPALSQKPSWLGSLRAAVLGQQPEALHDLPSSPTSSNHGPLRITPATPAAPALVSASPILCDSASNEAEDLPAIPTSITNTVPNRSYIPLRVRASLAALRNAVGLAQAKEEEETPTLRPRMDWRTQGSQFAGWTWDKGPQNPMSSEADTTKVDELSMGMRVVSGATIDYSQSFFYKPTTPPHPKPSSTKASASRHEDVITNNPAKAALSLGKRRSVKSLRAALLLPVVESPIPPVPPIPQVFVTPADVATPPRSQGSPHVACTPPRPQPPMLAISSPGAWEAGLPPRQLVLEGEEWDAKDGGTPGDWGRKARRPRSPSRARV